MNKKLLLIPLTLLLASCAATNNGNGDSSVNGGLTSAQMANALKDVADKIIDNIQSNIAAASLGSNAKRSIEHKHEVPAEQANEILIAPSMVYMAGLMYEQSFYKPCQEAISWTNKLVQTVGGQSNDVDMSLKMHAEANPEEGKIYIAAYQTVKLGEMVYGENVPCAFEIGYNFETNSLTNYYVYAGSSLDGINMIMGYASYEDGKYYHDDGNQAAYDEATAEGNKIMAKIDALLDGHEHVANESETNTLTDIYIAAQDHANELLGNTTIITTKR